MLDGMKLKSVVVPDQSDQLQHPFKQSDFQYIKVTVQ